MYQTLLGKKILILGCGNPLLGDDGFGPAVIKKIEDNYPVSQNIGLLDAGTSVRDLLFDLLVLKNTLKTIFIIDAVDQEKRCPGDIFEMDIDKIPENKIADYSLHQFPSSNMLKEFKDSSQIDIHFFAVQIEVIPDSIKPGLSPIVETSVTKMCHLILQYIKNMDIHLCQKEHHITC
jgi:coenzyme F420 hydrogenase subunit delta